MKKLVFGLIATILVTSLSYGQKEIKFSDYGFYHNEALSLYSKEYNLSKEKDLNSAIDNLTKSLNKKYPESFEKADISKIKEFFKGVEIQNFDTKEIWDSKKEGLYETKKISKKIGALVDEMLSNKLTFEDANLAIENLKKSDNLSEMDINSLIVMESVLKSSNSYWNSNGSTTGKKKSSICRYVWSFDVLGMPTSCYYLWWNLLNDAGVNL